MDKFERMMEDIREMFEKEMEREEEKFKSVCT